MTTLIPYEKSLPPEIPEDWNFKQADKNFDENIRDWRRLSEEVIVTLWVFYNKLKVQGRRTDLSVNAEKLPTWLEWIETKGIGSDTPLRHFRAMGWLPPLETEPRTVFYLTDPRYKAIQDRVDELINLMQAPSISVIPVSRIKLELKNLKAQINELTPNSK